MGTTRPSALAHGDRIAIVAPSSPFPDVAFFRGLAWLRGRYEIAVASHVRSRAGYLAGDDARRIAELSRAMLDPSVRAIVCARGGYGLTRIVSSLPWEAFARAPKWVVGFSDITAFHVEAQARGIATLHAPHVTGLGVHVAPLVRWELIAELEDLPRARVFDALEIACGGRAEGIAFGGNLALVEAMAAAKKLVVPDGAIWFLEDVTERPYRIDRMLTSLREGGYFSRASAIVFGEFAQCEPGVDGVRVEDVLRERTRDLGIPVVMNAPFGHGEINRPIALGTRVKLDGATLTL